MEFAACTFYAAASVVCILMETAGERNAHNALGMIAAAFGISLIRGIKLWKRKRKM